MISVFANAQTEQIAEQKTEVSSYSEDDIQKDNSEISPVLFEDNFQGKYRENDEFIYESIVKEKGTWQRFKDWLARVYESVFGFKTSADANKAIDLTINIGAILLSILVIYLIVKAIMNDEGSWVFGRSSDKKIIRYDEIEQNIHTTDFEKLIKEAEKEGDQRLSIRYYYLWLLKKLSENEIIEWDIEKTNSDYQNEIQDSQIRNDFSYLSYLYDYIWYGEFEIDQTTFDKAKASFDKIIKKFK